MPYDDQDFLNISGIQHFTFCRRRWALIFIECIWADNEFTTGGTLMHARVHDPLITEKRGDLLTSRDMPVFSYNLGITGKCDAVEFRQDDLGVTIFGRDGKWLPCPVEYKHGRPQKNDSDRLQLCAQAICLEEMLNCPTIDVAYIYYGETKRREAVLLNTELRERVVDTFAEMRGYYQRGYTPRVKLKKACVSCSLKDDCLPKLPVGSVREYIDEKIT
ncbi:MAG: CRISPR-associated protein Cas4 [Firmicutes bacterium]|nr:CRISPR-associated protein Cas4 [Bacillota bacterium]